MNRANVYAHILSEMQTRDDAESVISHMKRKGHLSLLPQVLRILARLPAPRKTVLTVARQRDAAVFRKKAALVGGERDDVEVVVDSRVVGGFMARKGSAFVDATFRRSLVSLYRAITAP